MCSFDSRPGLLGLWVLGLLLTGQAFAGDNGSTIDTRPWSLHYWQTLAEQGLVPVATDVDVPPAQYRTPVAADGPDVAVTTATNTTQSENSIFVSPLNNMVLLNSNNSTPWPVSSIYGTSHYHSNDGGSTWPAPSTVNGPGGSNSGDPAVAIGLSGRQYIGYITTAFGQGVAYSTNGGTNWTNVTLGSGGTLDKNHLWIDNAAGSPYEGNVYSAWTNFSNIYGEIEAMRSTNDGVSWTSRQAISLNVPAGSHHQGVNLQTGPGGEVYACWAVYQVWGTGQYGEDGIGFAKSTDGGATWQPGTQIQAIAGIRGEGANLGGSWPVRLASFPAMAVDISGEGPYSGNIYVVWTEIEGTDWRTMMIKSTDGGSSWSARTRIDANPHPSYARTYFPWITCDPVTGDLSTIYYDNRVDPTPNPSGSTEIVAVYVNNSTDGGATWNDEFQVSDVTFTPAPITGLASNYMGDYIGIAARGGMVYPCWSDTRVGGGRVLTYVSPYELEGTGGTGVQCSDLFFFMAKCNSAGAVQAMAKMNGDFTGEALTFDVDGTDYVVNVMSNGTSSICKLTVPHAGVGAHTVTLQDPAGCYSPVVVNCSIDAAPSAEWDAALAEYELMSQEASLRANPAESKIIGNYPNPFNPSTTISYSLVNDGWVSLKIFNTLGQEVTTLVNQYQTAGTFSSTWDGTNSAGAHVSSGIYLYRLVTGDVVQTQRMLLMK